MISAFGQKRTSTNPFGLKPSSSSAQQTNTPTPAGNTPQLNLSDDWSGWRTNNWALQYETLPWIRDSIRFARGLEPNRQENILATLQRLQNPQDQAAAFRAGQRGQATDQGIRTGQQLGMSDPSRYQALQQGAILDANNQAADRSADFDAYLQSPQGMQEQLAAISQVLGQALNPSAMGAYQGITNTTLGVEDLRTRLDQMNKKSGGILGQVLGAALGAATGGGGGLGAILGMFGGGGGGNPQRRVLGPRHRELLT